MIGGLGVALVCLFIPWPHWTLAIIGASIGAAIFGMIWAGLPAYLQAKRGSHIVITTIMFNFIAAGVLNFFLEVFLFLASAIIFLRSLVGISFKFIKCFILI